MKSLRITVFSVLWCIACVPLALAQGTYTQIDVPGALATEATGINKTGDVCGQYSDATGGHGFVLSAGVFTTIDYPGAQYSYLQGINDMGQVVGLAEPIGFVYDLRTQSFTDIRYPGAAFTYPLAINNTGTIAGYISVQIGDNQGFELTGSNYRRILPPGATIPTGVFVNGISDNGRAVGYDYAQWMRSNINFSFDQKGFHEIHIPNAPGALVYGINSTGTAIVGSYEPAGLAGFVYQNRVLVPLSFPGSISTTAFGVNPSGSVVGYYIDSNLVTHGFLWTPPASRGARICKVGRQ